MLAFCFARELQDDVVGRIGQSHGNLSRLPSPLFAIADKFEEHGFKFGSAGLHSLIGIGAILGRLNISHLNTPDLEGRFSKAAEERK
ncbi:hypothetical protein [Rhizobium sp. Root1203]|uniref:hypothetical protein n=1 Tax=Rhizobium sp. Root1203 TaxID=1736427 RepID=UPI000A6D1070|nr:hypothetical protein [Rhizobium sp. Root1203]